MQVTREEAIMRIEKVVGTFEPVEVYIREDECTPWTVSYNLKVKIEDSQQIIKSKWLPQNLVERYRKRMEQEKRKKK